MAIAVSVAVMATGSSGLMIPWLPFPGTNQTTWLLGLAVAGLLCVLLAVTGKLRILLFAFAIHTSYLLARGFFANSTFSFSGPDQARDALILFAGSCLAAFGSWPAAPKRR